MPSQSLPTPKQGRAESVGLIGGAVLLVVAGALLAWQFVQPAPPNRITIAAGGESGAYYRYAQQYRAILARSGITLDVLVTQGSAENLALLTDEAEAADVALIQGGVADDAQRERLSGLGSLFYEPIWLLGPKDRPEVPLNARAGQRIGIGPDASGTRFVALKMLGDNGIGPDNAALFGGTMDQAASRLVAGDLDLLFAIGAADSPLLKDLALNGKVRVLDLPRAAAYARRDPTLTELTLPEGTLNLARNIPERDVRLVAVTANLVARPDLHPALIGLLLHAATEIHGKGGLFAKPGAFPSPLQTDFPLAPDAARYYKNGAPFLQRYLPFWAANLIDRLKVMLLPLIGLLIPLVKVMPPVYRWRIRSRIVRWYRELQRIDLELELSSGDRQALQSLAERLTEMEFEAARVEVPLSYTDQLYTLRLHMRLIAEKLERLEADADGAGKTRDPSTGCKAA